MKPLITIVILALAGCNAIPKPQRGGSASVSLGAANPIGQGASSSLGGSQDSHSTTAALQQPENPSGASSQAVNREESHQTVAPVAVVRVTETPQKDGSVVRVTEQFAPQVLTNTVKEHTNTVLGAAHKDEGREIAAKLSAMRPVQYLGFAALLGAAAMFHPIVRVAVGGGKSVQMALGGVGLLLVFGPSLLVGQEKLILVGGIIAAAAAWGLSRLGYKEGQSDALVTKPKPKE